MIDKPSALLVLGGDELEQPPVEVLADGDHASVCAPPHLEGMCPRDEHVLVVYPGVLLVYAGVYRHDLSLRIQELRCPPPRGSYQPLSP